MNISYKDFGLYNIDTDYLKHLHDNIDSEVRYSDKKAYDRKPFLGLVVVIDAYNYFIPLTSAKPKHAAWKLTSPTHYTIYETIKAERQRPRDIIKPLPDSDTKILRLLAILDIKKMPPVPDGLFHRIDFRQLEDRAYSILLQKEFRFCLKQKKGIIEKAGAIYQEQKETGTVYPMFCNFTALEACALEYHHQEPA